MPAADLLPTDAIHVHIADDPAIGDPALLARYEALLSPEEMARRDRFHFPRHRHQFLVTRAFVRATLSRYLPAVAPEDWRFEANAFGRPHIVGAGAGTLDFNLSHTEGRIALAVCRSPSPGIDIERLALPEAYLDIAERFFAESEVAALRALSQDRHAEGFFAHWTMKEAYIKARGMGLSIPLQHFAIDLGERPSIRFEAGIADDPNRWQLWQLDGGHGYALSLALPDGGATRVTQFRSIPLVSDEPFVSVRS